MKRLQGIIGRYSLTAHLWVTGVAILGLILAQALVDARYVASGHPVDHATGQLAFDADRIEGYYKVMQEAGTLDDYLQAQILDFVLIAMIVAVSVSLGALAARLNAPGWGQRLGIWAAVAGVLGAFCDVLENLVSFVMLARPETIPQMVALTYSSFAAMKFAMLIVAIALVLAGLAVAGGAALRRLNFRP